MKEIRLWEVSKTELLKVEGLESVSQTETEELLEEILVKEPGLLFDGLKLVGRQTSTTGGPLDLLGVDNDGRLVVFELKRGTLNRDAVSQIIDYASYLGELDVEALANHIEERSGKLGIEKIENFLEWYQSEFADNFKANLMPKMVLVGLGSDDNTRRMVSFLSKSDLDVSLITFYAFKDNGKLLLARLVEVSAPPPTSDGPSISKNLARMKDRLAMLKVTKLYFEIEGFISDKMRRAYKYPNLSGYAYYLREKTETGTRSDRVYLSLFVDENKPEEVGIWVHERANKVLKDKRENIMKPFEAMLKEFPGGYSIIWFDKSTDWEQYREAIEVLCENILEGWNEKLEAEETESE